MLHIAIPLAISVHLLFHIFYVFNSFNFVGTATEKMHYFTTAMLPCISILMYGYNTLLYGYTNLSNTYFNPYFIEWTFSTVLLLMNLGRILHLKLYKFFLMAYIIICMNIFGILSNMFENYMYIFFGFAIFCYMVLMFFLGYIHVRRSSSLYIIQHPSQPVTLFVLKISTFTILFSWTLYPLNYILYKISLYEIQICIIIFLILDIISKSVLTFFILGYHDYINRRHTILGHFMKHIQKYSTSRIAPVPISAPPNSPRPTHVIYRTDAEYSTYSTNESYDQDLQTILEEL